MKMDKADLIKYLDKYESEHKKWPTYYEIELIKEGDIFPYTIGYFTNREEAEEFFGEERYVERDGIRYSLCFLKYENKLPVASEVKQVQCGARIVLPIKPEYAEKILNNEKWFEYRRKIPKRAVSKIVIYETAPVSKIVGEVDVFKVLENSPYELYKRTEGHSGISLDNYMKYFDGEETAYAYSLNNPIRFTHPVPIERYGLKQAPQSFAYVKD